MAPMMQFGINKRTVGIQWLGHLSVICNHKIFKSFDRQYFSECSKEICLIPPRPKHITHLCVHNGLPMCQVYIHICKLEKYSQIGLSDASPNILFVILDENECLVMQIRLNFGLVLTSSQVITMTMVHTWI